jgi:2-amino-4-hydroxy-6-hydroxymethyldihydropteridine diphosphokinase
MGEMNTVYLLLGSNEGNRLEWLQKAFELLSNFVGGIADCSSVYETAAWGLQEQPSFYNLVLKIITTQNPLQLLQSIQLIEQKCGRQRNLKWGSRTLDIDILFFNKEIIETEALKVPHPFMTARRFTMVPLVEIVPHFIHPILQKTNEQLLNECIDSLPVKLIIDKLITSF